MKILAEEEEEEEEEDYHPQLQDVELSHLPSLTYRLGQDELSSVHFDPNDNTDSSSSSSSSIASVTEYYDDDEYSISARDGDEEAKDNTTGCSSHQNKNSICTAICHQLGAVAGRCSHTPNYRRSTVIKNKDSPAYVVICRSLLIFAMITTIAAVIIVNSLSSSSSSLSPSPSPSQPSPSPLLSPQSHTIMDTEPHSEGEYHYEGIGHNVLEPHTIGTPSPPTTTAITYPIEGKPHQDDAHHYYESISHTILPVTNGLSTNNDSSSSSSSSSSTSTSTTTSNSANVNTYTNEVTSASVHAVVIPFANRYNLYFDGILFVKNATHHDDHLSSSSTTTTTTTSTTQSQSQSQLQQYDFDSYAKTLDPVTEIHFSPGESTNTKQIVLSTIPPDLSHDSNSNNSKGNGTPVMNVEHSALTIGLNSNGGLWFPHFTGESMYDLPRNDDAVSLFGNKNDTGNKKMYYGAGDRFVLKITNNKNSADNDNNNNDSHHDSWKKKNMIQLYRNNNRLDFIGEWVNPKPHQNLYGQIWFKDPNSSMFAYAINDRTNNNNDNNNNNNTTNGNDSKDEEEDEEGKGRKFRQRSLLRGRRDYFHEKHQENL